jgi:protein-S-isoprenylcysteine O-methyltransferase
LPPWYIVLVALIAVSLIEMPLWRNYRTRMRPSAHDRGTIRVNSILGYLGIIAGLAAAFWSRSAPVLRVSPIMAWSGIAWLAAGAALRIWSMRTLGELFTGTLQVLPDHRLVERGPYRLLRHPSYLGGDIALLGIGLLCGSWLSAVLFAGPPVAAHLWRIPIEERMMEEAFGDAWRERAKRTWRMLPWIW